MGTFDLYASLGFLFVNTAFQAKQNLTAQFQKEGFDATSDQFTVMAALFGKEGINQKEIATISWKTDSNLTRILRGMENKGLVFREKGTDARSRNVFLSDKGQGLYLALTQIAGKYMNQVFRDLSSDDQKTLQEILLNIRKHI